MKVVPETYLMMVVPETYKIILKSLGASKKFHK
jgi:hypothetical protein